MAPIGSILWPGLRGYQIFGANTDVGKTIFTTLLLKAAKASTRFERDRLIYLKPVSTGPSLQSDIRHIDKFVGQIFDTKGLFGYKEPLSPHIAAQHQYNDGKSPPSDDAVLAAIHGRATLYAARDNSPAWLFIETAGGVHSPGPSGTTQADLYMPLRQPVVLIGDSKLGGISQTISAFESLKIRGYDVEAVLLFKDPEGKYLNHEYLAEYFRERYGTPVAAVDAPPKRSPTFVKEVLSMDKYYAEVSKSSAMEDVLIHLEDCHEKRIHRLKSMATKAHEHIWYPFTQQKALSPDKITVIDSARGDYFHTFTPPDDDPDKQQQQPPLLQPSFDGSASWWTQGLGHGNPQLTVAAAYAAGRYGHVMFAETAHEPAVALAETLLEMVGNPRLTRVFYSDNGSTGVEVAVKMGLRASRVRYGWGPNEKIGVLGLKNGYHGDTMGAMDCAEPCVFNEKVEWYEGKGFWFDYPTIKQTADGWVVETPEPLKQGSGPTAVFESLPDIFDLETRDGSDLARAYEHYILETLQQLQEQGRKFGALIIEPIVLGAGGMAFVDPLFQRALVNTIRRSAHLIAKKDGNHVPNPDDQSTWSGLPVIADEVFTGLYRLGRVTASSLLGVQPDISVHAKLLTGGLIPMCATLASDSIFRAFESDDKSDALLHGHSYTAHPVGCQVALESLRQMRRLQKSGERTWMGPEEKKASAETSTDETLKPREAPWSMWSDGFVAAVAHNYTSCVDGVWALGTVLAIHMKSADGAAGGYKSTAAVNLRDWLLQGRPEMADIPRRWNVHSRVLGNVLYVMGSLTTSTDDVGALERLILCALGRPSGNAGGRLVLRKGTDGAFLMPVEEVAPLSNLSNRPSFIRYYLF